jgi:hypothetical protein
VKISVAVLVAVLGIIIGLLLYPVLFPLPELPEPIYLPGDPVIVYKDTTLYDTIPQPYPVEVIITPDRPILKIDEPVELFDGAVSFTLYSEDIERQGVRIIGPKLHLQTAVITVTDTLKIPHPVYIEKPRPVIDRFTTGAGAGLLFMLLLIIFI